MNIFADYHTHTIFSHGKGSVEDNIKSAIEKGLSEIAITDHDSTHMLYGIRKLPEYFFEIERCRDKYSDKIKVITGIEANLMLLYNEKNIRSLKKYDFIILGFHKAVLYPDAKNSFHFYANQLSSSKKVIAENTQAYLNAIDAVKIDILTHPNYGITADWERIAQACVKTKTAIEINNNNINLSADDYNKLKKTGVKFAVSSDAHDPSDVGNFEAALKFIGETEITKEDIINAR